MPSPVDALTSPTQSQITDVSYPLNSPRHTSDKAILKDVDASDEPSLRFRHVGHPGSPSSTSISGPQLSPRSPKSPTFTSLPPFPPSPDLSSKHAREQSRSFFANLKASKSSVKIQPAETTIRKVPQDTDSQDDVARIPSRTKSTPDLRVTNVSEPVPDLPSLDSSQTPRDSQSRNQNIQKDVYTQQLDNSMASSHKIPRRPVGGQPSMIDTTKPNSSMYVSGGPSSPIPENQESRKNGKLFHNFMKRNHSGRGDDTSSSSKPGTPISSKPPELSNAKPPSRDHSTGRSAGYTEIEDSHGFEKHGSKNQLKDQRSQSFRDGAGATLFSGIKNTTVRAAEGLGKAHNRFFRQNKQQNSNHSRTMEYSQSYDPKVINLPLIDQTRITRIARRLEDSKDKTEFWMPALPWRCIDFLNFTGCETEGLYRVPGSDREVRMWKQRFDQEHDVNLFDEEELYDVNTVGSLFKAWLRELPEDVFPQSAQEQLSARHNSEEKAPQELRDILSNLPPWNYYLLFAITCHLSLLHAHQEKNKMTYHNLFVCFAPALKMNSDCFRWLVSDWRNCWKGCLTEKAALEEEYRILDGKFLPQDQSSAINTERERSPSFSSIEFSQRQPDAVVGQHQQQQPTLLQHKHVSRGMKEPKQIHSVHMPAQDESHPTFKAEDNTISGSNLSNMPDTPAHNRSASRLPELSFPQPISPIFADVS